MKTEHRYRWHVVDCGREYITTPHFTEAQVRRDYPGCKPMPVLETLRLVDVPKTAAERLEARPKGKPH